MDKYLQVAKVSWFRVFYLLSATLFIYLLVSQVSSLRGSLKQLASSNLGYDLLVVLAVFSTFLFSAATFRIIAIKRLRFFRTVVAEIGINIINKLLPAGVGGIGGNYVYLRKAKHNAIQAGSVVFINNTLGVIGNLTLLVILLIFVPHSHLEHFHLSHTLIGGVLIGLLVVIIAILSVERLRTRLGRIVASFIKQFRVYERRKLVLPIGLVCQIALTLASVVGLFFSLKAIGGYLPLSSIMLAYSFAIWVGAIIPAPGGFGSVEAGLVGALVAFGLPLAEAVACVLLFRLISFWLPLIIGVPALIWTRRKGYI